MRKITNFIVKGRYFFLVCFFVLAGFSMYLATKVNINDDIMKYLPSTSETKIGKDIMEKDFAEQDTSILNVMFKGLSDEEKEDTLKQLQDIEGVGKVDYENTDLYNKDKYTLYVLNVFDYAQSKTATNVYNEVNNNFNPYGMSGSIYEENKPILQLWIVILAIACAMVILIILSESYLEPWLYLISIGIAIFINKGTNIMFDSVSSITNSIVAILQLALSMDYSIMLSNRYKQEKENHSNKVEAMKEALYQSFKAISSSSVTTIVGLIALVFMSFTIGKDLGFVLAKGVLLSLISIFFCLPALLLIFDNWIKKTKKKSIKFNLAKLGKFTYKMRFGETALVVILFVFAYLIKGNIGILYTGSEQDKVGKVFPATNQIAIVYNKQYEDIISDYCQELENDKKIDQVLCYSNTINEKLAYNELNQKLNDLGQNEQIDDYLIKLIYYNYYNKDENNKMTLDQFVSFIKSDIYNNKDFKSAINEDLKDNLDLLENFTSSSLINKKRTINEIVNILGINESDATNILIYYNSKNLKTTMTIKDFVDFILKDVAKEEEYANSIDKETIVKLERLQNFTDTSKINKPLTTNDLSKMFGIDESLINELFLFYNINNVNDTKLTLNEFAVAAEEMALQDAYKNYFDENTMNLLEILKNLSDENVINTELDRQTMKNSLNNLGLKFDDNVLKFLYIYYTGYNTDTKLTLNEFAVAAEEMALQDAYKNYFDDNTKLSLEKLLQLSDDTRYSTHEIANLLPDKTLVSLVFGVYDKGELKTISLKNLINFLNINKNNDFVKPYFQGISNELNLAWMIVNNTKEKLSYKEISSVTGIEQEKIKMILGTYNYSHKSQTMTPLELVNLILDNQNNELLINKLTSSNLKELTLVKEVMLSTLNQTKYTANKLSELLGINDNTINLIFSLYNYKYINSNQTISLFNYVNFMVKDVMNNPEYASNFDKAKKEKLITINKLMDDSLNKVKYSKVEAYNTLMVLSDNLDKSLLDLVYMYYGSIKEFNPTWKMTIEEFINYLNSDIITDSRFTNFINEEKRTTIIDAKETVNKSKKLLVSNKYSRMVLNTKYALEDEETYNFINTIQNKVGNKDDIYVVGNSAMAVEMSKTFNNELNKITILTMIFIFVVVAITFKDLIIPFVLVLIIQTAVYLTMSAISLTGGSVYFISLLIVQAILMGATIDYAIVYTSYYRESRLTMGIKDSVINAYNRSINTIISSSSILIIVTLVVANFASAIAAKICETISYGTLASVILILFILPGVLATTDKLICRRGYFKNKK